MVSLFLLYRVRGMRLYITLKVRNHSTLIIGKLFLNYFLLLLQKEKLIMMVASQMHHPLCVATHKEV